MLARTRGPARADPSDPGSIVRYLRTMPRSCARPGCSAPATATFTFDGLRRIVWLGPLAEASAYSAGDLCRRHAELLKPPRHWEMRDVRPVPGAFEPAGSPAPSRYAAPAPPPLAPAPTLPFERAATRAPARPAAASHRPARCWRRRATAAGAAHGDEPVALPGLPQRRLIPISLGEMPGSRALCPRDFGHRGAAAAGP